MSHPSEHANLTLIRTLLETPAPPTARQRMAPIPWPPGLEPQPFAPLVLGDQPLPHADVLIVTWTVAEAQAAADVLTPGVALAAWTRYTNGYAELLPQIRNGAPAYEEKDLARYYMTKIGTKTAIVMKSDLHMSQDGPKLPVRTLWAQMINQSKPSLVISTGTAGGIGADVHLGDVILTDTVRFDCQRDFKNEPFAHTTYVAAKTVTLTRDITALLEPNAALLPTDDDADGKALVLPGVVLTTDFFAFDNAEDSYGLRAYDANAAAVEMGDAVLGLVCAEDLVDPPAWVIARNASDPQIPDVGTLADQTDRAAAIYKAYGYTTTIGSAIVCWSLVADLP